MPGALRRRSNFFQHCSARWMGCCLLSVLVATQALADDVLVRVNGEDITTADLQLEAVLRRIPAEQLDEHRQALLNDLIDQRLIAAFVSQKRAPANLVELESQVERIHAFIRRRGEQPDALFARLGISEERLSERLAQSLAWEAYVRRITTDEQLRDYFEQHRRELDGTELRASHIILKVTPDDEAARMAAKQRLAELRERIISGDITFDAAAVEHSESPRAQQGGDVGFFANRGTMSTEFSDAAFALKVSDVSGPVESPFGVHLIKVTDERPGQLSLEDVRPLVLERISRQLRAAQLAKDRPRASIEWK